MLVAFVLRNLRQSHFEEKVRFSGENFSPCSVQFAYPPWRLSLSQNQTLESRGCEVQIPESAEYGFRFYGSVASLLTQWPYIHDRFTIPFTVIGRLRCTVHHSMTIQEYDKHKSKKKVKHLHEQNSLF